MTTTSTTHQPGTLAALIDQLADELHEASLHVSDGFRPIESTDAVAIARALITGTEGGFTPQAIDDLRMAERKAGLRAGWDQGADAPRDPLGRPLETNPHRG